MIARRRDGRAYIKGSQFLSVLIKGLVVVVDKSRRDIHNGLKVCHGKERC